MALNLTKVLVLGDDKAFGDTLQQGLSSFVDGLTQGPNEVLRYDFRDKRIGRCQNCGSCNTNEFPCSFLDDFNVLATLILDADSLVLFAEGNFSSALANALGKFTAFTTNEKRDTHLQNVILVYLGSEAEEKEILEPWVVALLNLAPQKTQVIRYDSIGEKEKKGLTALGVNFSKR